MFALLLPLMLKAVVILLLTSVTALVLRRASAAVRHLVWTTGLVATLLLPVASAVVPAWPALSLGRSFPGSPALAPVSIGTPAGAVAAGTSSGGGIAIVSIAANPTPAVAVGPGTAGEPAIAVVPAAAPPPAAAPRAFATPGLAWGRIAAGLWAIGAAAVLAWLAAGHLGVRRLTRGALPLQSPEWLETVEDVLAGRWFRRTLTFLESDTVETPCTWGIVRPVILLPASGVAWSPVHRRHVVVHELAHVERFDCLTHVLGRLACALHWYNPLAWVAARAARVAREHACDDAVLNDGGRPSDYADLLLEAAQAGPIPMPAAALAMARRSQLGDRLIAVLDPARRRRPVEAGAVAGVGTVALGFLLPIGSLAARSTEADAPAAAIVVSDLAPTLPAIVVPTPRAVAPVVAAAPAAPPRPVAGPCPADGRGEKTYQLSSSSSNVTITGSGNAEDGKGNRMVVWSSSRCSVAIRSRGNVVFTPQEDDVASLAADGKFDITHEEGSLERRYTVTVRNGTLERRYTVDGVPTDLNEDARAWRARLILEFIRRTGYDAPARVSRIRRERGFGGLVDEIGKIDGDGGRARYLELAFRDPSLEAGQASTLLGLATTIESDGDRAQVLGAVPLALVTAPRVSTAYVDAVTGIESDGDKTGVLERLVRQRPSAETLGRILEIAQSIESDGDRSGLLKVVVEMYPGVGSLPESFFDAARGIESDGDLSSVLIHAMRSGRVDPASAERIVALTEAIDSDGDRSAVLSRAIELKDLDDGTIATVLASSRAIGSDGDRSRVLVKLADRGLVRTPALRRAYQSAAREIGSDGDRERALRAIGQRDIER